MRQSLAVAALLSFATSAFAAGTTKSIADGGAVADGKTMNTATIQKVIDDLAASGGGTVVVPAGKFLTGALDLKPGVNLHLDKDGVLLGSQDVKDYPTRKTRIEGHFQDWLPALINAEKCDHLVIDGEGTLDGQGTPFYAAFRAARGAKNLDVPRPRLCFIRNSSDVTVKGIHFLDSGFWNLHLYDDNHVTVDGLDIHAPNGSPSTDGIDVDSCQYITINNCTIYNNDDGIAVKGSKGPFALDDKDSPPDEHIHVTNCTFLKAGSVLTCGSEATVVKDVVVEHCTVKGPDSRGLSIMRLKLRPDTPQHYEDIHFKDITLDNSACNLVSVAPWRQYFDLMGQAPPKSEVTNITMSDIHGAAAAFGGIQGNDTSTLTNMTFENIDITTTNANPPKLPAYVTLKNVKINGQEVTNPAAAPPTAP